MGINLREDGAMNAMRQMTNMKRKRERKQSQSQSQSYAAWSEMMAGVGVVMYGVDVCETRIRTLRLAG